MDAGAPKETPKKITLDLSTTLGEYSGLVNTPLSPPLKFIEVTAGHGIEGVDESGRM